MTKITDQLCIDYVKAVEIENKADYILLKYRNDYYMYIEKYDEIYILMYSPRLSLEVISSQKGYEYREKIGLNSAMRKMGLI